MSKRARVLLNTLSKACGSPKRMVIAETALAEAEEKGFREAWIRAKKATATQGTK